MWFLTLILFVFILGLIVLVHELGHFLWAKAFGVHIYEFSIGMGPIIHTWKGKKDKINYNLRALPIGGFVSMAGEVYEDDKKIAKNKSLCNKPVWQRIIVMVAGVTNNFIMALLLIFVLAIFFGSFSLKPKVLEVIDDYPMAEAGIVAGDTIVAVNNHKVNTWDEAQILLYYKNKKDYTEFQIKHEDGKVENYKITPVEEKGEDGEVRKVYGIKVDQEETHGFFNKIKYTFQQFWSIVVSMWLTIVGLVSGKVSIGALSGPVGIYSVVGQSVTQGVYSVIYLIAYLSINVGIINLLPVPAFDGGRVVFLIIEKIKGSPINPKIENWFINITFILLMLLVIVVTINDIIRLF